MRGRADYEGVDVPKVTAAVAALVLVLALAGCADDGDSANTERSGSSDAATTPAPLEAESTEPTEPGDSAYLDELRRALEGSGGNSIPNASDDQLIEAGRRACEQMAAGTALEEVRVVENEPETGVGYKDSLRIAAVAAKHYCTEYDPGS